MMLLLMGCSKSKTEYGAAFVGTWQLKDDNEVTIAIKQQVIEGVAQEHRYVVEVHSSPNAPTFTDVQEGQYNYQLVTSKPQHNIHPLMEFLHKNTLVDPIPYFGLTNDNKVLEYKYRNEALPTLQFTRVNN